jgi:DNA repair protein RadC
MGNGKEQQLPEYEQQVFDLVGFERSNRRIYTTEDLYKLHRALEPFIDLAQLRRFAAEREDIYQALRCSSTPTEVVALLDTLRAVLRPTEREQIKSPRDIVSLLMVEMSHLDQEELRTVLLDTKNRLQGIATIYKGSLNTTLIRVGEVYKEAIKRNSAAIILVHNHPSGEPEPSPEDVIVTSKVVAAGQLLDVECLDHIIIGQGKSVSLRERRLGFIE